jgi:hypothetical protein
MNLPTGPIPIPDADFQRRKGVDEESASPLELLQILERGLETLSPFHRSVVGYRLGAEGGPALSISATARRVHRSLFRIRVVLRKAQEHLRALHGPGVPELLRLLKESWLPPLCPLTPALLERWRSGANGDFRLPPAAQVRLIALVAADIPCWADPPKPRAPHSRGEPAAVERWLERYLKKHGGAMALSSAFADILNEPGWEDLEPEGFLAELKTLRRLIVDFAEPEVPWLRLG